MAGLGFGGVPSAEELEKLERAFRGCGAPVSVELAHLGDPRIAETLTARGYRLVSFENVLGRPVSGARERDGALGVDARRSPDAEFDAWLEVIVDGFAHPDEPGVASHEEFPRDVIANAERDFAATGVVRYTALIDGVIAGGGSFRVAEGVAQFAGAATAPPDRRRGVQSRGPGPSPRRTCSVGASNCSTPGSSSSSSPIVARPTIKRSMRAARHMVGTAWRGVGHGNEECPRAWGAIPR